MMDEYFDHFISSSSCVGNEDARKRFPWASGEPLQVNLPLVGSIRLYDDDKRSPPVSMISSNKSEGALAARDSSPVFLGNDLDYAIEKGLISGEAHKIEVQHCNGSSYPSGIMNGRLKVGNLDLQYNSALPTGDSLNRGYQKHPPTIDDLTSPPSFIETDNAEYDGTGRSDYHSSFKELQNHSILQQFWSVPSYGGASYMCPVMLQYTVQELGLPGGDLDDDVDAMGKRYASMDRIVLLDKLSGSAITEGREYNNCPSTSLASVCSMEMTANELSSLMQNTSPLPTSCCNGTGKSRVRARRGQATDPHSIAERLRREKIAERMRNLQGLIPHSTKLDKASMLDEIIEYVKFLQLQVKVLSMSRLGGAGAVIPLAAEGHAECSSSFSFSPSAGLGIDISLSADQISFKQEVVKLMESNVTMAMQYLQSRGLCLLPMSHALAMLHGIASLGNTASNDRKESELENIGSGSSSNGSCSLPGIEAQNNMSCDGSMNEQKGGTEAS